MHPSNPHPTRSVAWARAMPLVITLVLGLVVSSCRPTDPPPSETSVPTELGNEALDLTLTGALFQPRELRTFLIPNDVSFSVTHNRPNLAKERIDVEFIFKALPVSGQTTTEVLLIGKIQRSLPLDKVTQWVELTLDERNEVWFPPQASGFYHLEVTLNTLTFQDPTPTNNTLTLDGAIEVRHWNAHYVATFSRKQPLLIEFNPGLVAGLRYDNEAGDNWTFLEEPRFAGFSFESTETGLASLTVRYRLDSPTCETAQLAILINAELMATDVPTRQPIREHEWAESTFTISLRQGMNHLDLIAGEPCGNLQLQAVTIAPKPITESTQASPNVLPISSLDPERSHMLTRLATAHEQDHNLDHARELGQLARQSPALTKNPQWELEDLDLQRKYAMRAKDPVRAEELATRLIQHAAITSDSGRYFDSLNTLATCYEMSQRVDLAIETLENSLAVGTTNLGLQIDVRARLTDLYLRVNQPIHARSWALEALEKIPEGQFEEKRKILRSRLQTIDLFSLSMTPQRNEHTSLRARLMFETLINSPLVKRALAGFPDLPQNQGVLTTIKAGRHFFNKDYEAARNVCVDALKTLENSPFTELAGSLNFIAASCDFRLKRWEPAITRLNQAVADFGNAFKDLRHPLLEASVSSLYFATYYQMMQCFYVQNRPTEALFALEVGRSRSLANRMASRIPSPQTTQAQGQGPFPYLVPNDTAGDQMNQLVRELTRDNPHEQKTLIVEYAVGDEESFVYVVTPRYQADPIVRVERLSVNRLDIQTLVRRLRQRVLRDPAPTNYREAQRLSEILLSPIQPELASLTADDLLCIVPFDILWELPFGALPFEGQNLGARQPICLLPSLQTLAQMRRNEIPRNSSQTLAMISPSLPQQDSFTEATLLADLAPITQTDQLVKSLVQTVGPDLRQVEGSLATETFFKEQAAESSELILVTHGVLHEYDPDRSGIFLAADDHNDGFVSVSEILALELQAELTFVAACHSGQGQRTPGEGVVGLSWALLAAGSESNLVALHQVEAENTFALVARFQHHYRELKKSNHPFSKARALFQARTDLADDSTKRHPFYLDSIVLIGDWE